MLEKNSKVSEEKDFFKGPKRGLFYCFYVLIAVIAISCFADKGESLVEIHFNESEYLPPYVDTFQYNLRCLNELEEYPALDNQLYGDFMLNIVLRGTFKDHLLRDSFELDSVFYGHFGFHLMVVGSPGNFSLADINFPAIYYTKMDSNHFTIIRSISRQYTTTSRITNGNEKETKTLEPW